MKTVDALIIEALKQTGSTWISQEEAREYTHTQGCDWTKVQFAIKKNQLITCGDWITTKEIALAEDTIAVNLMKLQFTNFNPRYSRKKVMGLIDDFEKTLSNKKINALQREAIYMIANNFVSILTGGPGTGKTTTLTALTYVLRKLEPEITICFGAPTGQAAKKITLATSENATTVHKKCNYKEGSKDFSVIEEKVFIIDESSMIDNELSSITSSAIKNKHRVIFVGDENQLCSIGLGAVLRDLIQANVFPFVCLKELYRQDKKSVLYENIMLIKNGDPALVNGVGFNLVKIQEQYCPDEISQLVKRAYLDFCQKYTAESTIVLVPYRNSGICANSLNNTLQATVNKEVFGYRHTSEKNNTCFFKLNDFVMNLRNRDECANGDVGKIINVDHEGLTVQYAKNEVHYSPKDFDQLCLAYATTIHKSQGSEYDAVIFILLNEHQRMFQRNLIYTGVTRAKKECRFFYQEEALKKSLQRDALKERKTFLAEKLTALRVKYKYAYGL